MLHLIFNLKREIEGDREQGQMVDIDFAFNQFTTYRSSRSSIIDHYWCKITLKIILKTGTDLYLQNIIFIYITSNPIHPFSKVLILS